MTASIDPHARLFVGPDPDLHTCLSDLKDARPNILCAEYGCKPIPCRCPKEVHLSCSYCSRRMTEGETKKTSRSLPMPRLK